MKMEQEGEAAQNTADITQDIGNAEVLNVIREPVEESWIMDSGCSFHICSHESWFEEISECQGSVLLGNDQICEVKGIGKIRLKVNDGTFKILSEVRYIPYIKRNLISLGMLESKGYGFSSEKGIMKISHGSRKVMEAVRKNNLYYLLAHTVIGSSNVVNSYNLMIWDKRLGHVGEKGIKELVKVGAIKLNSNSSMKVCEECILGKSKKLPFVAGKHCSTAPLEYTHSDLWGPSQVESKGG